MMNKKKGAAVNKSKTKGSSKNLTEVANTSSGSGVTSEVVESSTKNESVLSSTEIVSSSSVVQSATKVAKSESRSNVVEVRSSSREIVMDSQGNVIKVIEHAPKTVKHSSSTSKAAESSSDFISAEQTEQIKSQSKRSVVIDGDGRKISTGSGKNIKQIQDRPDESSTVRIIEGGSLAHSSSSSHVESIQKSSSTSSSTFVESSSSIHEDHSHKSSSVISSDKADPVVKTSSKSVKNVRSSQVLEEGVTKDGQTVKRKTEVQKAGQRVNDNGKVTSSKTESVDSETTVTPATNGKDGKKNLHCSHQNLRVTGSKNVPDKSSSSITTTTTSEQSTTAGDVTVRNVKPGASTWDGKFITERPAAGYPSSPKKVNDKRTNSTKRIAGETSSDSLTEVRRGSSTTQQKSSSSTSEVRESSQVDEKRKSSNTVIQDEGYIAQSYTLETVNTYDSSGKLISSVTRRIPIDDSFVDGEGRTIDQRTIFETDSRDQSIQYSRQGDSSFDVSDPSVFQHQGQDGLVETTRRVDSKESNLDGSYNRESTSNVRTAKGSTESSQFLSHERVDINKESYSQFDDGKTPRSRSDYPENTSVVRRTKPRNDSVEVQDITEEVNVSNVSESVTSSSYIVEHSSSTDMKGIGRVTSIAETIIEEEPSDRPGTVRRSPYARPETPEKGRVSTKPGQSTWDGHFIYEKPQTPTSDRRRPTDGGPQGSPTRRTDRRGNVIDIRDVTEDNSINEADIVSTSYVVEHSSSQQSFSDSKDFVSMSSVTSETVGYDGQPGSRPGTAQGKYPQDRRPGTPQGRPGSPDKTSRPTKPGSSTWDGSFLYEKTPEQMKPTDSKRQPVIDERKKPIDGRQRPTSESKIVTDELARKNTRHVSDTTLNISDTSEVISSSYVVEQSKIQESYTDSKNVDFSTLVTETVIIVDGKPVEKQTTHSITDRRRPGSPEPRGPGTRERIPVDRASSPDKKTVHPDDKSTRPTKPGSSTWDGSFVIEKTPGQKKPGVDDKRKPSDGKQKPDDEGGSPATRRPSDSKPGDSRRTTSKHVSESSLQTGDVTEDVSRTSEVVSSSIVLGQSNIQESYTDSKNVDFSTSTSETWVIRDGKPVERQTIHTISDQRRPGSPDKRQPGSRERIVDAPKSPDKKPGQPDDKTARPTKPGSSTWDGSFIVEKTPEKKKPIDTRKEPGTDDRRRPSDGKKQPTDDGKKPLSGKPSDEKPDDVGRKTPKHVSETTLNIGSTTTDISRKSDVNVTSSSFVVEESSTQEIYSDSRDLDFSTSSTETVILRDGKPVERQTTYLITDQRSPGSLDKKTPLPKDRIVERPGSPDKKGSQPEDRNVRPTKPGSSTWDGSFLYEKPQESPLKPGQKKEPGDDKKRPTDDRKKPTDGRPQDRKPTDTVVRKSSTTSTDVREISEEVKDITDVRTSTYVIEQSSVTDSKKFGSSVISEIISYDEPKGRQPKDDDRKPRKPEDVEKSPQRRPGEPGRRPGEKPDRAESPEDKSIRPTKPGSSTWDGSFTYEKPQESPLKPGQKKEPGDEKERPIDDKKKPTDGRPQDRKPTDTVIKRTSTTSTDVREISEDVRDITDIRTSTYVVEQSSVTDSKKFGSSVISEIISHEEPKGRRPKDDDKKPRKPGDVEKSPQRRPDGELRLEEKPGSPDEKSVRPTKPGSSTWDGSFVQEKPQEPTKKPGQKKEPKDDKKLPTDEKKKPIDGRPQDSKPTDTIIRKTSTISSDVTEDIRETSDLTTSSYDVKRISKTTVYEEPEGRRPKDDDRKPKKPEDVDRSPQRRPDGKPHPEEKPGSPDDKSARPTKPGSSTWNGAFVYEQPKEPITPSKKPGQKKEPTDDKKTPIGERPKDRKPTDTVDKKSPSGIPTEETPEGKKPKKPDDTSKLPGRPGRPGEKEEPEKKRPESPEDKSARPTKPGSSTWDGSFTYEKPEDTKKPEDDKKHPGSPKDLVPKRHPSDQRPVDLTEISTHDVTDIKQSSFITEHSSSFTSVKDVRDFTEERIVTDYTTDKRHDLVSDLTLPKGHNFIIVILNKLMYVKYTEM